jgi:hypothetical protein
MSQMMGVAFWSAFVPIVAGLVLLFVRKYCRPETERLLFDPVSVVWRRWRGLPPKPQDGPVVGALKVIGLTLLWLIAYVALIGIMIYVTS